jgi:NAD(P)-dependent dehydrogenase (short-subunit alcohol dehydrogenase family)
MIIITGASRGIGKYLLETYLKNGFEDVIGTYMNTLPSNNISSYTKLDVTNYDDVSEFVEQNMNILCNLTLINCAGVNYNCYTHKSEVDKWKAVVETNLFGTYNMIRCLLPIMRKEKFGRIINFSSVVALKPTPGVSSYATSKSALWGLSKSVAAENAIFNITINNINLGYSVLGMIEDVPDEYLKNILLQIPLGRFCEGEEILNTVNYLKNTGYITGSSIDLTGGLV